MIVPAIRDFVGVPMLVTGHRYHVDSHMGGSYPVRYLGTDAEGFHRFEHLHPELKGRTWLYAEEEVPFKVYLLIPENPAFRSQS
jgi:hypothetical protein